MFRIHTVFVSPNFGISVFAVSKTVYGYIVDCKGVSRVIIVTDFDSRFPRRAVVAVVESAVIYRKVRRFCRRCLTVKKDRFTVGIESAVFEFYVRAAPGPYRILICHIVFESAVYNGCFRHLL